MKSIGREAPRGGSGFGREKAREAERLIVAVAIDHQVRILPCVASGRAERFEVLVLLRADVVVETGHARGGKRANSKFVSRDAYRTGEAITGTVAGDSIRFDEGERGLHFGERRRAVDIDEKPFGAEENERRGCRDRRSGRSGGLTRGGAGSNKKETARNEAAACFMGPQSGIKNGNRKF